MNDKQLRQDVIDELDFEPSIDSADIGVTAENGVITLTGHVASYAQKMAAEHGVWRVKGVKAIAQEIQVRLAGDKKCNDDEIAQRALSMLAWDSSIPRDAVHVKVQDGLITLTGKVSWHYQRDAAEADMRKLSGVLGVFNDLSLVPVVQPSNRTSNDQQRRTAQHPLHARPQRQQGGRDHQARRSGFRDRQGGRAGIPEEG